MQLRDYQETSIQLAFDYLRHKTGEPCLVLPTGAGKSVIIAEICRRIITNNPQVKILMLTHVKELIEQNYLKVKSLWQNAPIGIFSAGLGRRQLGEPITFGGIQSLRNRANDLGHIDLIIVDECDLISHKDEGGYRFLINALKVINPKIRILGLTATPYRLGHGMITDKPAIFDDIIEPVSIEQLIYKGYLAPLRSKHTHQQYDVSGVSKVKGDYKESELAAVVDTDDNNEAVINEIIARGGHCLSWIIFCAGVAHSEHMAAILNAKGIIAASVTGNTSKTDRAKILQDFKDKKIRVLTNCDVLTTGFDAPDIDLLAMCRPTLSPRLYVQMAGRGTRLKSHTDHCLVLDFAGNVQKHGAITAVQPPKKKGERMTGEPPSKICDQCYEIVHASVKTCPACGFEFPQSEKPDLKLHDDDIMGIEPEKMYIEKWQWEVYVSKAGKEMLTCQYEGESLSDPVVKVYHCILHGGWTQSNARRKLMIIANQCGADIESFLGYDDIYNVCEELNNSRPPTLIEYTRNGNFYNIANEIWG